MRAKIQTSKLATTNRLSAQRNAAAKSLACSASVAAVLMAGCNVGPKYVKPTAPAPPAFKESSPAAYNETPAGTWQPASPADATIRGKWWEMFHDDELNSLEDQLNINNQNIAVYFQDFMAARALVGEAKSQYYPTVSTSPSATRSKTPAAERGAAAASTTGITSNNFAVPLDVSWAPDLWGRVRNLVHESQYAAQISAADLEGERLTEQASLAEYYFELRGQDSLQDLYTQTVKADKEQLNLINALYQTGIDNDESVAQAEVTLQSAEEAATSVQTNRAIYEHAIAMLIGKPASSFSLPVKPLTTPIPPIPVGLPSDLLQRRPDIAAAERAMAESNALIGIEQAAYYPNIVLSGAGGLESAMLGSLFSVPALFWSAGASASETIFDAGLRHSTIQQYKAEYDANVANYRQTVLTAFEQVEDSLSTMRITSQEIQQQASAVRSAQRYMTVANSRYETGLDPYINVMIAEDTLLGDQQLQVTLQIQDITTAVQLVESLGGGWNVAQLPKASAIASSAAVRQVSTTP
ncbi:MAG: efflux transporter outer membrane subunit [Acidobacteria bacterium]|nr:efflux transporter outer membrane subunit [Acidobacteriota bacterium]